MEQIGRYRILKRLGGGGFGEVFLGEDAQIDRLVAIKVFRPKDENLIAFATSSDEEGLRVLRERFIHEARILAGLEASPHIVNVFDFGELEDGAPYYVMAYVPRSLSDAIGRDVFDAAALQELAEAERPRALDYGTALEIFGQTLEGMAAAHARGLVHRDIKPSNILLTDTDQVRVADFGIAKAPDSQHSTVSHLGLGSRNYMAPEQRESAKHVDARADVYALGVLAYRLFTGRLPTGRYADPDVHQPQLAAGLNQLILDCLQENRDDRPADAEAVLASFRTARDEAPQASDENATGTNVTLAGGASPGLRSELAPLVARIQALLLEHGEITPEAQDGLEPLAAIQDLDADDLDALIKQVAKDLGDRLIPVRNLQALIRQRVDIAGGPPRESGRKALHEAGAELGWSQRQVDAAIDRAVQALPVELRTQAPAPAATAGTSASTPARRGIGQRFGAALALIVLLGGLGGWWWSGDPDLAPTGEPSVSRQNADAVTPVLEGGEGLLAVRTEPPGAVVRIAGQAVGETPLDLRGLRAGRFDIEVDHPRYRIHRFEGEVIEDHRVTRLEARLQPASGSVTVLSEPSGAWIELTGRRVGETPTTLEALPVGPLSLKLGVDEHHPQTVELLVVRDAIQMPEPVTLEPITFGRLTLDLVPEQAEVVLPDIEPRYRPGMRLPEGRYRVRVTAPGYEPRTATVDVSGSTRERIELERRYGTLTLDVNAPDASISLPDVRSNYRPGMRLPEGDHRVRVSAPGYEDQSLTVLVAGHTAERVTLMPLPFRDQLSSGGEGPGMVLIPRGEFEMGSPSSEVNRMQNEGPQRTVRIEKPFALGVTPVTFSEWERFVESTNHRRLSDQGWGRGDRPAITVSWPDAQAYVDWLSNETGKRYRLPSEAEWEYAARGGTTTSRWWGEDSNCTRVNHGSCGLKTLPVGQFGPNPFGLYDLLGQVWEWTEDCWNDSYESAPTDGSAWTSGDCERRMLRGGSWNYHPRWARSAARREHTHTSRYIPVGFRIARDL